MHANSVPVAVASRLDGKHQTFCNPGGRIKNLDLEMARLLLLWLTMEGVSGNLREIQVALVIIISD